MKKLLVVVIALVGVVAAPSAQAGCWATVKLSSLPRGLVWNVSLTPLQHGVTSLPDAKPRIEIRKADGPWRVFAAKKTTKAGVFRARVVFASTGVWRFRVWDGFEPSCARYHSYAAVTIRDV
jgi:hypothetical protein